MRQKPLIAILILAAVLRAGVVCWKYENLSTDTDSYLAIALNLLSGEGYCSVPGHPTAYRPPLYPIFLAVCLFGGSIGLAVAQVALGTATCGLAWMFARRIGLQEKGCLLTALLVTIDPLLLLYTSHAMTETLVTFIVTLFLVAATNARSRQNSLVLGFLFGLTVLCRPSLWSFGGLAVATILVCSARKRATVEETPELKFRAGLLALGVVVAIAPWTIRNWIVLGKPVVMTTHGGYTLLLANNPVFYDFVVDRGGIWENPGLAEWQRKLDQSLADDGIQPHDELARDSAMRKLAIHHIQQSPATFVRSCFTRVLRFWSPAPKAGSVSSEIRIAVAAFYLVVFVLFAIGLVHIRRIGKDVSLGLILVVSLTVVHSVFWSNARMRAPVTVVVALVAASSIFPRNEESKRTEKSDQTRVL